MTGHATLEDCAQRSIQPQNTSLPGSEGHPAESFRPIDRPAQSRKECRYVGTTLAPVAGYQRRKVLAAYRALGGRRGRLNDDRRALLTEAIFQIENDLEHRQPKHPQVAVLCAVRNRLYDDLGWNEYGHRTYLHLQRT